METINVIKIGGNVIDSKDNLNDFLKSIAKIETPFVLVHGGGKLATRLADKVGIKQKIIEGRRVTNSKTLKIATMVYAGLINKKIVARLQKHNKNTIGLSGADGNVIKAKKRLSNPIDYGFVGDLNKNSIQVSFLKSLIDQNISPVFCAITHDGNGQLLNTNADTIANFLAIALSQVYKVNLIYCFEKVGVLLDANEDKSVITNLDKQKYLDYKSKGIIHNGMIPKLDNCFYAIENGVKEVSIINSKNIFLYINKETNEGTRIK